MNKNEKELAEAARELVLQFNFETRTAIKKPQVKEAQTLYRAIFYEKAFLKNKSRTFQFHFFIKKYQKMTVCKRCAKSIYEQLKEFSDIVLEA